GDLRAGIAEVAQGRDVEGAGVDDGAGVVVSAIGQDERPGPVLDDRPGAARDEAVERVNVGAVANDPTVGLQRNGPVDDVIAGEKLQSAAGGRIDVELQAGQGRAEGAIGVNRQGATADNHTVPVGVRDHLIGAG